MKNFLQQCMRTITVLLVLCGTVHPVKKKDEPKKPTRSEKINMLHGYHKLQEALSLRAAAPSRMRSVCIAGLHAATSLVVAYIAMRFFERHGQKKYKLNQLKEQQSKCDRFNKLFDEYSCANQVALLGSRNALIPPTSGVTLDVRAHLTMRPTLSVAKKIDLSTKIAEQELLLGKVSRAGVVFFTAIAISCFIALRYVHARAARPTYARVLASFAKKWPTLEFYAPPLLRHDGKKLYQMLTETGALPYTEEEAKEVMQKLDLVLLTEIIALME